MKITFKSIITLSGLLISQTAFAVSRDSIATTLPVDEVVITGSRNAVSLSNLPMTVSTVGRETLTENQRYNILPTLTEQVPGLFSTSRGVMGYGVSNGAAGGMMLRGISSGSGQMMVLIDGHPQYQGIYGHSIADSYQTLMIDHVEVMRGPASLLYGSNAMGGVINIITRKDKTVDGSHTSLNLGAGSYGTFQAEIGNQYRHGTFSLTSAANYSRSDNHRPNMGFEQYGAFVKMNKDFGSNWNTYADIDITHFNSSYPGTVTDPMLQADQWITRGVASVGVENHYDNMNGRVSGYYNFGFHKINDGYKPSGKPQTDYFRSKDALTGISFFECFRLWQGSNVTLGFDYQSIYGNAYYTNRRTGEVNPNKGKSAACEYNDEVAGYLDIRQDLFSWLTIDAGIRYDHHSVTGSEWIPQAGIAIRPMHNGTLKLMAGKGFRNPTMKEMYLYAPANEELQPERLQNYEISWKQSLLDNRLRYALNLFYIDAKNIIQTIKMKNVNTGSLRNKGIELEASYYLNRHWSLNTNHSYLHMDNPIVLTSNGISTYTKAPKYKGYLGAHTHYGRFSATLGLMYTDGLYGKEENTKTNESKSLSTDHFTLLNATLGYALSPSLQLWLKGENLLAQRYEYIIGYPMPRATFMAGVNVKL